MKLDLQGELAELEFGVPIPISAWAKTTLYINNSRQDQPKTSYLLPPHQILKGGELLQKCHPEMKCSYMITRKFHK